MHHVWHRCSERPSNNTAVGLLRSLDREGWLFSRAHPDLFMLPSPRNRFMLQASPRLWRNASSPLRGYRSACWSVGGPERRVRCQPLWVGIGLHKSGTSSLFDMFGGNKSRMEPKLRKEPKFWVVDRGGGCAFPRLSCYMRHLARDEWFGDATVPQTWHIHAPLFLHAVSPTQKIIATLREALDLLESRYHFHFRHLNLSVAAFGAILLHDVSELVRCQRGSAWRKTTGWGWDPACFFTANLTALRDALYADSLHPWLARFEPEQLLFLPTTSLSTEPHRVARFLGIPPSALELGSTAPRNVNQQHNRSQSIWDQLPAVQSVLQTLIRPMNDLLSVMAGRSID